MTYKYVYRLNDGIIINKLQHYENVRTHYKYFPEKHLQSIGCIESDININMKELNNYKVEENQIIKMTIKEILEIGQYGKTLTEEERQLNKLKPSLEEIRKAEQTIEILTLIQEVM